MEWDFRSEDPDTREEILAAAYRALRTHGYANLTIQRIGAEFDKSPSLVYHHYDGKDELLVDLLSYVLDQYDRQTREDGPGPTDPRERIDWYLDLLFAGDGDDEWQRFTEVMMELRAQAVHDDQYRRYFTRSTEYFQAALERTIREGVESGAFRAVDPETVAAMVHTLALGTTFRRATTDDGHWLHDAREELDAYLESTLYATDE